MRSLKQRDALFYFILGPDRISISIRNFYSWNTFFNKYSIPILFLFFCYSFLILFLLYYYSFSIFLYIFRLFLFHFNSFLILFFFSVIIFLTIRYAHISLHFFTYIPKNDKRRQSFDQRSYFIFKFFFPFFFYCVNYNLSFYRLNFNF